MRVPPVRRDRRVVRTDGGEDRPESEQTDAATVETVLREANVLEPTADGTDLRLAEGFAEAWHERMDQMRGGDRALRWLAASEGLDADALDVTEADDRYVVAHGDETVGAWHSRAGFLAAIVAEPTIREWVDEARLARLPDAPREELAARLVMCLERCPTCDSALAFEDRRDGESGVALRCRGCGATVAVSSIA
ncbi:MULTISPECIES: hypothetical protein [Halomicrobium]|uniref:DUF8054 domain-containing protein n=1 Tax=Halomicrobium mukohataei (strain ATCC 700874 / DSM 12286 / JCM 9738 / NCIMB 13541) TaxID=485914 RepID=C7NZB9_HALMD|nr:MULTISPECIES: hypothetical protein [Halomicrobium]ACV46805.1 hypothetical protein Hmuk_0673 [Halomicrobium mukohataei DSM 12286]